MKLIVFFTKKEYIFGGEIKVMLHLIYRVFRRHTYIKKLLNNLSLSLTIRSIVMITKFMHSSETYTRCQTV